MHQTDREGEAPLPPVGLTSVAVPQLYDGNQSRGGGRDSGHRAVRVLHKAGHDESKGGEFRLRENSFG